MAKVTISTGPGGAWIDKSQLKNGDVLKLVSEAKESTSQQGSQQWVAKALVKGGEKEPKNIAINKPSLAAMIDAFGDDTINWTEKLLTVNVEKTNVGGKRGYALYLIPEGFEVSEDTEGFIKVLRIGTADVQHSPAEATVDIGEEINPEDIPF